jgi:SAM-dependent methyltransferase
MTKRSAMTEDAQATLWNDVVGDAWVRHVEYFDATLASFGDAVIQRLDPAPGDRVLDIGCGVGTTTFDLAALVPPGEVVGVDLSARMLGEARPQGRCQRASPTFASLRPTSKPPTSARTDFDLAFSRCGVMFFPTRWPPSRTLPGH